MACSFRPDLVERAAGIIASEARALGVNQLFAPLADLARELRFGRVEETFGEDSYLYISPCVARLYRDHANCQCRRNGTLIRQGSSRRKRFCRSQALCKLLFFPLTFTNSLGCICIPRARSQHGPSTWRRA